MTFERLMMITIYFLVVLLCLQMQGKLIKNLKFHNFLIAFKKAFMKAFVVERFPCIGWKRRFEEVIKKINNEEFENEKS